MKRSMALASALFISLLPVQVFSTPGGNAFAEGFDGNVNALPPGRLKQQIQKLPSAAQQQALKWLERFNIPTDDYEFLGVDSDGRLFYIDTVVPDEAGAESPASGDPLLVAPEETFLLHSRPGASKVVFLDFDGHDIAGTAWNSGSGSKTVYYARAYDTDNDPLSFSDEERNAIAEIWHRVAEDMAPFDIDVTTEDPGGFGPETGHVLITSDIDDQGDPMPHNNAGGVAYVGVWGASYYTNYQPALVYFDNLGNGYPPYVAEASTHEFGHNLGLGHDGASGTSYYSGHGSGYVSWAPIMGVGYYNNVTQWSKGEYAGANNTQDDLQIISSQLNYRLDDHGDNMASATALQTDPNGTVYVTFPEIDPFNQQPENKGIIETSNDLDLFWFDTAAGGVTLNITPAWEAFYRTSRRGANLDIKATLYDQQGSYVASSDLQDDTRAQIDANLTAGRYYLEVTGVGSTASPYSDYGSLGMYFVSGSLQPVQSNDSTPPNPDPMSWAAGPAANGRTAIAMTATTANDDSGVVQYQFNCTGSSGGGCVGSSWQSSAQYQATGLTPGASYSYQVKARDLAGNETGWSVTGNASTDANQPPQPVNDNSTTDQQTAVNIPVLSNDTDPEGDSLSITGFTAPAQGAVTQSGSNLIYTPSGSYAGSDSFSYTVSDGFDSVDASVFVDITAANAPPVAVDDSATVATNGSVTIDVLENDSDADTGAVLTIVPGGFTQGNKGSVSLVNGQLVYEHTSKKGGDSFTYTITDGEDTDTATVNITISRNGGGDDGGSGGGGKCHPKRGC